jgi:hypothetical protein
MTGRTKARGGLQERIYRGLLRIYPTEVQTKYGDQLVQLFGDQLRDARSVGSPARTVGVWLRSLGDLATTAASEHVRRDRPVGHSLTTAPSPSSRALGLAGILGGIVLLSAFAFFSLELNWLRLLVFNAGAIAIVIAVTSRQAATSPALALIAGVPAVAANALFLIMVVLSLSRTAPVAGDFGLALFWISVAMWLSDAWFAIVTVRLGVMAKWGPLALAIGSALAVMGIDRLGLTSGANPTIFGTLSQIGIVLNGVGWILLGLDVATRRRPTAPQHALEG